MAPINTAFNNLYAALIVEVSAALKTENLLTDEIERILENLKTNAKTTKKATKKDAPKRGMNGYNLFMKENRADMAEKKPELTPQQMTGELAKVWKELGKEAKEDYNTRAKAMSPVSSDTESSSDIEEKPTKSSKASKAEKSSKAEKPSKSPKAEKSPKASKKPKAPPPPPPVESEEETEEASSDIDI